ncbi:Importin alpha subunit (Karyopherin alpha subunit) (Serine-rich RNA polymerase I suppressor protein) [Tulasnella sp. 417]|nr:Importin alpha subunit (Karyopherin alpha subunit) (Serine-rich RNA polymerase I suppressor protein) [Tulasnella sp. 417]
MAAMTESAATESFANLNLNDEVLDAEGQASEEDLNTIDWDGYTAIDERAKISRKIYPKLFKAMNCADQSLRLKATIKIRRSLQSEREPIATTIQPILDAGILPAIIDLLSSDDSEFLFEATWILVNITAGSTEQTAEVVEAGALPKLIPLFPVSSDKIKENILMIVGNIMGDSKDLRLVGIREGGFNFALDVLRAPEDHSTGCVGTAAWVTATASSLEHGGFPDDELVSQAVEMIAVLTTFIRNQRDDVSETLREIVIALRQLSVQRDVTTAIRESEITCQLVQLCTAKGKALREDALRIMIQMGGGGMEAVQALMGASCLCTLSGSHDAERARSRMEKTLMGFPLLPHILQIDPVSRTQQELRVEAAALTMDPAQVVTINLEILDLMVDASYFEALSQAFLSPDHDTLIVNLHALEQILNAKWDGRQRAVDRFTASGGPGRLRDLRARRDTRKTEAASVARRVLQTHFPEFSKWPRV